jgi:hypothetical protein
LVAVSRFTWTWSVNANNSRGFQKTYIDSEYRSRTSMFGVHLHHLSERERAANIDIADEDILGGGGAKDRVPDYRSAIAIKDHSQ